MQHVFFARVVQEHNPRTDHIDHHNETSYKCPASTSAHCIYERAFTGEDRKHKAEHEANHEDTSTECDVE